MAVRVPNPEEAAPANVEEARKLIADLEADLQDNWETWDVTQIDRHDRAKREWTDNWKTTRNDAARKVDSAGASEERAEAKAKATKSAGRKKAVKKAATTAGKNAARRRRGRNRYAEQTGIPGFGRSTTSVTLQLLGTLVGLSALYLILSPNGSKAYAALAKAVEIGVGAIVNPVDPLAPGGKKKKRTQAERLAAADAAGDIPALLSQDDLAANEAFEDFEAGRVPTLRPPASLRRQTRPRRRVRRRP